MQPVGQEATPEDGGYPTWLECLQALGFRPPNQLLQSLLRAQEVPQAMPVWRDKQGQGGTHALAILIHPESHRSVCCELSGHSHPQLRLRGSMHHAPYLSSLLMSTPTEGGAAKMSVMRGRNRCRISFREVHPVWT